MLLRSWLTFAVVIAIVQGVLAILAILQHNAILSELQRQRISVIAQTTAASFQPIIDLGLPISMIRNGDEIVARALVVDPAIRAIHALNPSGIVVHSTLLPPPQSVPREILRRMQLAGGNTWSLETEAEVFSGRTISGLGGAAAGAVVVAYPKDRLQVASTAMQQAALRAALLIWVSFSVAAYVLLRLLLAAPQRAVARLERISRADTIAAASEDARADTTPTGEGLFGAEVARLEGNLGEAERRYHEAARALDVLTADSGAPDGGARDARRIGAGRDKTRNVPLLASDPSRSLARALAARLAPLAAIVIIASALTLGLAMLQSVNRSIEPELAARTNLIGTVVSDNVQRALDAGAPLDKLVGAENYFGDMLTRLPEVAYVAVATGRIVLEAGERIDPYLAPPRQRKDVRSHPIINKGEEIAYVVIDIDPAFISKRFRDVFLDISVVILVTVLAAFEIMVLLTSRSLTAALDRLQRLAAMQAVGDFSKTVGAAAQGAIAGLTAMLVARAEALHDAFVRAKAAAKSDAAREALEAARARYGLGEGPLLPLRVSYFTDIRLALFLFAAADHLPLAFLPLYTREADNLWPWLDQSVLISLPLAGYLLAILVASPFARALTHRLGVRMLFLAAGLPLIGAHLGLYVAGTAQEIIVWRTLNGVFYALTTLACQDYVLDTAPTGQRDRTLGVFTLVLFGGVFSGVALGGVLADRLGQHNVFLLSATLIAMSAGLSAWLIAPGAAKGVGDGGRFSLSAILSPVRNWRFAAIAFGVSIPGGVVMQAFVSYLAALTLDSLGASTADIGRALMLHFLGIVVAGPLGGRLAEAGVAVKQLALAGAALAGASLTGFLVWPLEAVLVGALFVSGIGFGLVRGAQVSLAMTIAETELAGQGSVAVLGSLRMLERLGSVVGLLVIAGVAGTAGYKTAIGTVAVWSLAGATLFAAAFLLPRERVRGAA